MKQLILAAALPLTLALTPPAFAQDEANPEIDEGFSLMEEGARLLFRGLMDEVEPAIDDFTGMAEDMAPALEMLATEMGPALVELFEGIDSITHYEPPEILPNGDIIIRRSPDAPLYIPPEEAMEEGAEVEL